MGKFSRDKNANVIEESFRVCFSSAATVGKLSPVSYLEHVNFTNHPPRGGLY